MEDIKFDVMLKGIWICTLRMPVTIDIVVDWVNDKPVIPEDAFSDFIEKKRPSLKGKPYNIEFCTGKPTFAKH